MTITINLDRKFYTRDENGNRATGPHTVDEIHAFFKLDPLTIDMVLIDAETGEEIRVGDIKEIFPDG